MAIFVTPPLNCQFTAPDRSRHPAALHTPEDGLTLAALSLFDREPEHRSSRRGKGGTGKGNPIKGPVVALGHACTRVIWRFAAISDPSCAASFRHFACRQTMKTLGHFDPLMSTSMSTIVSTNCSGFAQSEANADARIGASSTS